MMMSHCEYSHQCNLNVTVSKIVYHCTRSSRLQFGISPLGGELPFYHNIVLHDATFNFDCCSAPRSNKKWIHTERERKRERERNNVITKSYLVHF